MAKNKSFMDVQFTLNQKILLTVIILVAGVAGQSIASGESFADIIGSVPNLGSDKKMVTCDVFIKNPTLKDSEITSFTCKTSSCPIWKVASVASTNPEPLLFGFGPSDDNTLELRYGGEFQSEDFSIGEDETKTFRFQFCSATPSQTAKVDLLDVNGEIIDSGEVATG